MSEHQEYCIQQIVWATVQQSPAWPAKIVRKLNQHGKTVYKVNFFGDPSYCYLHSHSLCPFSAFESLEQSYFEQNQKLKRAIELAKFCFSKHSDKILSATSQSSNKIVQPLHLPMTCEQTQVQSKEDIDLPQKTHQVSEKNAEQNCINCFSMATITPLNVIEALNSYRKLKNTQVLENLKRKQIICFQNDLKQNLLFKYKLHAVEYLKQTPKTNQCASIQIKNKRFLKRGKKARQGPKFEQKQMCLRRVQKILIQKGLERHRASKITLKIFQQIQNKLKYNSKSSNPKSFKEDFIQILYQISSRIKQFEQIEQEYLQKQIISFIDIEYHQNKMEEGSRTTQMYEQIIL